jgi:hypothetical protein
MADEPGKRSAGPKRVLRTGIALVHRNEVVMPAPGSEAEAEVVMDDARAQLEYYFPVEIEVRGAHQAIDSDALADLVLRKLAARLDHESD